MKEDDFEFIKIFCVNKLNEKWPRDDYCELLELVLIFLGEQIPNINLKIRQPGAYHHARWMAKAIYSLKIYLFRNQFKLLVSEIKMLLELDVFIVKCYKIYWFTVNCPETAPLQDLIFLRSLYKYPVEKMSKRTTKKFLNHLYY